MQPWSLWKSLRVEWSPVRWVFLPEQFWVWFSFSSIAASWWRLIAWHMSLGGKQICLHLITCIWAATWQNQQNECVPSEDSNQPGHLPSLIRVFAVRMKKAWILSYPLSAHQRLWSDWADLSLPDQSLIRAQADLSLRLAHTHFVGFVMSGLIWSLMRFVLVSLVLCSPKG